MLFRSKWRDEERESIKGYLSFLPLSLSQPFPIGNVRVYIISLFRSCTPPYNEPSIMGVIASMYIRIYIFIYSFFAKEQGGLSAPSPSYISPLPPETSEVCTRGNRRFRRRAELDDRRACTRSCSSDTDSRCRLHWSRLTGRDYYKGGWRDVRIYSGQGMREGPACYSTTRHRDSRRERERYSF